MWLNSEVVVVRSLGVAWFFENDLNEGFSGPFLFTRQRCSGGDTVLVFEIMALIGVARIVELSKTVDGGAKSDDVGTALVWYR